MTGRAAVTYAQQGWAVHPLRGKVPLLPDWPRAASADPATVADYWDRYPRANVGCHPGASGLVVFDEDSDPARAEAEALGLASLETLTTITARGRHLFFRRRTDDRVPPMRIRDGAKVDGLTAALEVKCDGANIALPPSVHPTGAVYRFADPEAPIAPCPADVWWRLVELARGERGEAPADRSRARFATDTDSVIAAFNAAHSVAEILAEHGYVQPRKRRPRYLAPRSTTRVAGVVTLIGDDRRERAFSHHANDPIASAERRARDAFDLFCILQHRGNVRAAVRAAAEALGMAHEKDDDAGFGDSTFARGDPFARNAGRFR